MGRKFCRLVAVAGLLAVAGIVGGANGADEVQGRAELAKAMAGAKVTLQTGIKASVPHGKPISAKFEVEDGKLQLSVYTMKGAGFSEVVASPISGKVEKAEAIAEKDDLEDAQAQKAAMDKARVTLLTAADNALKSNRGYRVVSVVPEVTSGHPVANVTLLRGTSYKTVSEKLD